MKFADEFSRLALPEGRCGELALPPAKSKQLYKTRDADHSRTLVFVKIIEGRSCRLLDSRPPGADRRRKRRPVAEGAGTARLSLVTVGRRPDTPRRFPERLGASRLSGDRYKPHRSSSIGLLFERSRGVPASSRSRARPETASDRIESSANGASGRGRVLPREMPGTSPGMTTGGRKVSVRTGAPAGCGGELPRRLKRPGVPSTGSGPAGFRRPCRALRRQRHARASSRCAASCRVRSAPYRPGRTARGDRACRP